MLIRFLLDILARVSGNVHTLEYFDLNVESADSSNDFLSLPTEKLVSLLPEYVVPYMIHLLAHDPDFTKPQDYDQLKDIKESVLIGTEDSGDDLRAGVLRAFAPACVGASGLCWKC